MIRRQIHSLSFLFAAVCLSAALCHAAPRPIVHRIGVLAKEGKADTLKMWTPLGKYLESRIPGERFEIVPLDYDSVRRAVGRGQVDFLCTNPAQYVELNKLYDIKALASAKRRVNGVEMLEYGSVVFVPKESAVRSLRDLRGKRVAASAPLDFGGWIIGQREIRAEGLMPDRDFSGMVFAGSYGAVVESVLDGLADAGIVRTGVLERMEVAQRISLSDFRIIRALAAPSQEKPFPLLNSTRLYPDWPFAALLSVEPGLSGKVAQALLALDETSPAARMAEMSGWSKPGDYSPVLECLKELRLGYFYSARHESDWMVFRSEYRTESVLILSLISVLIAALVLVVISKMRLSSSHAALVAELSRREKAEVEREVERLRAAIIMGAISEGVMELDAAGTIVFCNPVGERLLGWKPGEMVGRPAHETCHHSREDGKPYPREHCPIARACAEGGSYRSSQEVFWRQDGTFFHSECVTTPLTRNGLPAGAVVVFRDLSSHRRMEVEVSRAREAAEAAHSAKTFFMANMTHELRTPISAITGFMDLTLESSLPPVQREYLLTARRAADHLLSVINDILDISKIESSQLALETVSFDLKRCVSDAIQVLRPQAEAKNLYMRVDLSADLPAVVSGDAKRLAQVISNLVSNAIKFTHNGGITIHASVARSTPAFTEIKFVVTDTGIGISPEYAQNIFKPFSQGDSSSTRKYGGNGLGLAIVRHVVSLMGGRIWFEPAAGGGTSFHFLARFNVTPGMPGEGRIVYAEAQTSVLVVADRRNKGLGTLFAALDVLNIKYEVMLSQRDALEACAGGKYAAVIVDLQSPGVEASVFPRLAREHEGKTRIPMLAMTADMDPVQVQACLEAGYDAIIGKPLVREDVARALASTLHR